MRVFRADWVLPISAAPRARSWVGLEAGRIAAVGQANDARLDAIDLGRVAILPGLVNAHTHLELSFLHGAIPPVTQFTSWIREVMRLRREHPDPADASIMGAAETAIRQARAAGTALVGDISNTLVTPALLAAAGLPAVVFYELIGFRTADADAAVRKAREQLSALPAYPDVRTALAAHAPYSVAPDVFKAIRADLEQQSGASRLRSSVHVCESPEEVELVRTGTGGWRALLEEMGLWTDEWRVPGGTPLEYLDELGFLDRDVLAVHGVQFAGSDLDRLRALDATVVSCPRSNRYVGVGSPPLEAFYAMDVRVAFGTDSLASVADLNVFAEIAEARRVAPRVAPRALLHSATLCGAEALGFGDVLGSIEVGKRAALIAVRVPDRVDDVEEYLVSGVEPSQITWLDESDSNPKAQ